MLKIRSRGGKGDADLYLKLGSEPNTSDFDKESSQSGNDESIEIANPQAGEWFLVVQPFTPYSGMKLLAQLTMGPGIVAPLIFQPTEGIFSGKAVVRIRSLMPNVTIRYELDGSNPDATSPLYARPLSDAHSMTIKARGFKAGKTPSAVTSASVTVHPESVLTELKSGEPAKSLAGSGVSDAFFHFVVSDGQDELVVTDSDRSGATNLFAKFGALPMGKVFDARTPLLGRNKKLTVKKPAAGDWYIRLHSTADFADVAVSARAFANGADLVPVAAVVNPSISIETFAADDCDVVEGWVKQGTRRLLRFATETRNVGNTDVALGRPEDHPDLFVYSACHGHYHFAGYANYRLLDSANKVVAVGTKAGFCLEDVYQWDPDSSAVRQFTCDSQGISTGWADVYDSSLGGQWIDITGVPAGDYLLEITVNPAHKILEVDYGNNTITVPVHIPAS
ncbi:MAG: hypothetical protein QOD99_2030 [Chthoniobacter sp.]|jgi:hypothetical protein|nr:hypothetical protein [Chthoniobacter sp.]